MLSFQESPTPAPYELSERRIQAPTLNPEDALWPAGVPDCKDAKVHGGQRVDALLWS